MVTGLRVLIAQSMGRGDGAQLAAGQVRQHLQDASILHFLLQDPRSGPVWGFSLANLLLYVCLFFTIYSGFGIFLSYLRHVFSDGPNKSQK